MPPPFGKSYQPGTMPGASPLRPGASPQEAVQVLNLRLPKTPGPTPIPQQLLGAQGAGGDLNGLLRALVQAFAGTSAGPDDGSGGGPGIPGRELVGPGGPAIDTGTVAARTIPPPRVRPGSEAPAERGPDDPAPGAGITAGPAPSVPSAPRPLFDIPDGLSGGQLPGVGSIPDDFWTAYGGGRPLF